jgi:hypothetical protein
MKNPADLAECRAVGDATHGSFMWYATSMPKPRPRRIVRRAVMAVAGVVLLPVGYLGSLMMLAICITAGWIPKWPVINAYAVPYEWYLQNSMPGYQYAASAINWAAGIGYAMAN